MAEKKPLYQPWSESDFSSDLDVRAMSTIQQWMYRTLLQRAFVCSTRPYLPNDDDQLWKLAGCQNRALWDQHKTEVRAMFTVVEDLSVGGNHGELLIRKRVLNDWSHAQSIIRLRKKGGRKSGESRKRKKSKHDTDTLEPNITPTRVEHELNSSSSQVEQVGREVGRKEVQNLQPSNSSVSVQTVENHGHTPPVGPSSPVTEGRNRKTLTSQQIEYSKVSRLITGAVLIVGKAKNMGRSPTSADVREELKQWAADHNFDYDSDMVTKAVDVAVAKLNA